MAKRKHAPISTECLSSSCDSWGRAPSNKLSGSAAFKACMDAWFGPRGLGSRQDCCAQANACKPLRVGFTASRGHSRAVREEGGFFFFLTWLNVFQACFITYQPHQGRLTAAVGPGVRQWSTSSFVCQEKLSMSICFGQLITWCWVRELK